MNKPLPLLTALILVSTLLLATATSAQPLLRNEWIDYGKTYYRFAVAPATPLPNLAGTHANYADYNQLHRIPFSTLQAYGLANTPVEDFQLWRNGEQVPIYTFPASGLMGPDGFIEFWGQHNDGKPDRDLYRFDHFQINDRWNLFTDTAYYYLTVNPGGGNLRITDASHDPLNSTLTPDSFFMHTIRVNPRTSRNLGFALNISGTEVRAATFDNGEGWGEIRFGGSPHTVGLGRLYAFRRSDSLMRAAFWAQGQANINRSMELRLNDSVVAAKTFRRYNPDSVFAYNIPLSRVNANDSIAVTVRLGTLDNAWRSAVFKIQLTYPRRWEFDKKTAAFVFELPASTTPRLLKLVNFDTAAGTKILLDLTNRKRYELVRVADTLWVELAPSASTRQLVLTATDPNPARNLVRNISALTPRNFVNYALPENQADYLIISNSRLYNANGQNYVEAYRQYRASAEGGGYRAAVFDIADLTEQFAYNITMHPLAIRNFLRFGRQQFSQPIRGVFLIGRGATYNYNRADTNVNRLHLVPTWGHPASDNLLAAADNETITPATPIGRLAAIDGFEVKDYLDKVMAFEAIQRTASESKIWQKNVLHLIGGNDPFIVAPIKRYMNSYTQIISDTLAGADVTTYLRLNDPNTSANNEKIRASVANGVSLITYFGHSSATNFDFNLNDPDNMQYTPGRLPVFLANGCKASEFFDLNARRLNQAQLTLSERFVLSKGKGSVAFISSTHFGIMQYLNLFTTQWYIAASRSKFGDNLGNIHREAIQRMLEVTTLTDQAARLTAEEFHLHGDPVLRMFSQTLPDYVADSSNMQTSPATVYSNTDSVRLQFSIFNAGKATRDSVKVQLHRRWPSGYRQLLIDSLMAPISNNRTLQVTVPVGGVPAAGTHQFELRLDTDNQIAEADETNNQASISIQVHTQAAAPIFPAPYAIVNSWPTKLVAANAHPTGDSLTYRLQIDTTALFNSAWLYSTDTIAANGSIIFLPTNTLQPNTVYYWRVAPVIAGLPGTWQSSSFTYLPGTITGSNMGHYYQHLQSNYVQMHLDSLSRLFTYNAKKNNLYIVHGMYPYSALEDADLSITPNGITNIFSGCIGRSIIINVFDSISFIPFQNPQQVSGNVGFCGPNTPGRIYNFEMPYSPASARKRIMDFIDSIPTGQYVVVRLLADPPYDSTFVRFWQRDTLLYGSGNSLYHRLKDQGFYEIDSMNQPRTFSFVFRKNDSTRFKPAYVYSQGLYDLPVLSVDLPMTDTLGTVQSPWFGPALRWDSLSWNSLPIPEANGRFSDSLITYVLGKKANGVVDTLFALPGLTRQKWFTGADSISASTYRYLSLQQRTADSDNGTPHQLDYWRLYYQPAPEGSIMPGSYFEFTRDPLTQRFKDTLTIGVDTLRLGLAFENLATTAFADSLTVTAALVNEAGMRLPLPVQRLRPLAGADSLHLLLETPLNAPEGFWSLYVGINADGEQPEVDLRNNFMYHRFFARLASSPVVRRVFNGTGTWSDSARWTPYGLPQCGEQVLINGDCTVDIANAVADSLEIAATGSLRMLNSAASLNLGCSQNGGNKLMTVRGRLQINNGELAINGALYFVNGSQFEQSGGIIYLDPNTGDSASSFIFAHPALDSQAHPLAILAFGGTGMPGSKFAPFSSGSISLTGGTIQFTDPPHFDSALALFVHPYYSPGLLADSAHNWVFGSGSVSQTDSSHVNCFLVPALPATAPGTLRLGSVLIRTGNRPGRSLRITGQPGHVLLLSGELRVEEGSTGHLSEGVNLRLQR